MKKQDETIQSQRNDDKVTWYKIQALDSKYIRMIVKNNTAIRFKFKLFNADKLTNKDIEKSRSLMLTKFKESKILRDSINVMWHMQCEKTLETLRKYPERKALEEQVDFKHPELMLITSLWDSNKEEHQTLGDELYEVYKQNKEKEKEGITMGQMNQEMSLSKCIEYITTTQEKIKHLEALLQEKEEQIHDLKKGVDPIPYLKECKKQIVATNNNVEACMKLISKQESYFDKKIETIEKALATLGQQISKKEAGIGKKDLVVISDTLTKSFKQMKEEMKEGVKNEITNALESYEKNTEVKVKEGKAMILENDYRSKKKEDEEVEDELADILKGLQL